MTKAKRVLWFSRHMMSKEQKDELISIYGEIEVIKAFETLTDVKKLIELGTQHSVDIYAVVLPPMMLMEFLRLVDKPVLRSYVVRQSNGNSRLNMQTNAIELEYKYEHKHWERVKSLEIIVEKLSKENCE